MNGARIHLIKSLNSFDYLSECEVALVGEGCVHQLGSIALVFISVGKLSIYHLHVCHLVLTYIKPKEILRKSSLRLAIISKLLCNFWAVELQSSKFRILESEFEIIIFDILI